MPIGHTLAPPAIASAYDPSALPSGLLAGRDPGRTAGLGSDPGAGIAPMTDREKAQFTRSQNAHRVADLIKALKKALQRKHGKKSGKHKRHKHGHKQHHKHRGKSKHAERKTRHHRAAHHRHRTHRK